MHMSNNILFVVSDACRGLNFQDNCSSYVVSHPSQSLLQSPRLVPSSAIDREIAACSRGGRRNRWCSSFSIVPGLVSASIPPLRVTLSCRNQRGATFPKPVVKWSEIAYVKERDVAL